jgi:cellobiose epimerase
MVVRQYSGSLAAEMEKELESDILPFWIRFMDRENGGFYGRVENDGRFDPYADKGLVMHARFLWTYAAAARLLEDTRYLDAARFAYRFLAESLADREHGGFHWICDCHGTARPYPKVVYGQAFALYSLAEYARAGGPPEALQLAMETFRLLEKAARDQQNGGYFEAAAPDWSASVISALGEEDAPCAKSMNTNLHMLEALTALHEATGDAAVGEALRRLVHVHLDRILGPTHLGLFYNTEWSRLDNAVSYGHDIESSWLLTEAAESTGEQSLAERVRGRSLAVAAEISRTLEENDGSLPDGLKEGRLGTERIWWVQAEGIVGMVNAWQISGDSTYLRRAERLWEFVKKSLIDHVFGEWLWGVRHPSGAPMEGHSKGGLWKASYHNGRACMEVMRRMGGKGGK